MSIVELMNELKITLVQAELHWEQSQANLDHFDQLLSEITSSDLIILPEMFSTGFTMKPLGVAETENGNTVKWMRNTAQQYNSALCGSVVINEKDSFYNRMFFVFPDGNYHTYDKRHLFTLAGEEKVYSRGEKRLLIHYRGWKIVPFICYDLRFPVWCRNSDEAELMLFVANWPERRSLAWKTLLRARAIENMCYVAGVNRVGNDGNNVFHSGDSGLYDERGRLISDFRPGEEEVKTFTLKKDVVRASRERFSFLKDRDQFQIEV
ncbi:MAG: amidohydrolase [Owenweeksia sp.]